MSDRTRAPLLRLAALSLTLGLLLGAAQQAHALKCKDVPLEERAKASAVVFGEVVSVKGRTAMIKIGKVLKGQALLKGVETLRWHRHSRYIYLPPKGALLLLFLDTSEIGKPDANKVAKVIKPSPCNTLETLRRGR